MFLVGTVYNFCTPHASLHPVQKTTPAMAAGITDHCWTNARTAVVSGATATLGTTLAARASLTGPATRDGTVVLMTTVNCGATGCLNMIEIDN
jgi:hypothetical protein